MVTLKTVSWLSGTVVAAVATVSLLPHTSRPAQPALAMTPPARAAAVALPQTATPDSGLAARFLDGLRGASPLACEMAIRSLGIGWGWRGLQDIPDAALEQQELLRWASGRPRDASIVPRLRAALADPDACVRRMTARLLGRMRTPAATTALLDALDDADEGTRVLAAIGLGYAEDHDTVDPLMRALRDDAASVRAAAAWALGEIEDRRALPSLTRLLGQDPDPGVRRAAALAIGDLH